MVSVCMATYNGEKWVYEQVESILKQLDDTDELIVSDDMSTDKTVEIVQSFNDSRIKVFYHEQDRGFAKNFENALSKANGDIIILSDQDDIWLDGKVSLIKQHLSNSDFVVHDCITVENFAGGSVLSTSRFEEFKIKQGFVNSFIRCRYLGCCMAFNKNVLKVLFPFPKQEYMEHDRWIAFVSERYFNCELIKTPLIYYRRHGGNASAGGFDKGYSLFQKIKRRIYWLKSVNGIKRKVKAAKAEENLKV